MFPSRIASLGGGAGFENTYSLSFDGVDDNVSLTSVSAGIVSTVSFWIKRDDPDGNSEVPLGEDSYSSDYLVYLQDSGDAYKAYIRIGSVYAGYSANMNDTNWHHLAFTRNGDSISLYKDGDLVSTSAGFGTSVNTAFDTIGSKPAGTVVLLGKIDEVAIFDAVVTVGDLRDGTKPADLTGMSNLQGWWRFEEGSGTSAIDSSTNSNAGTFASEPAYSTDVPS